MKYSELHAIVDCQVLCWSVILVLGWHVKELSRLSATTACKKPGFKLRWHAED